MDKQLQVIKRNGELVDYDVSKIEVAIAKACLAEYQASNSSYNESFAVQTAKAYAKKIDERLLKRGDLMVLKRLHIEAIQDEVELFLMRESQQAIASRYIIYRKERAEERQRQAQESTESSTEKSWKVVGCNGIAYQITINQIFKLVKDIAQGLTNINFDLALNGIERDLIDGIDEAHLYELLIFKMRDHTATDQAYSLIGARLQLRILTLQLTSVFNIEYNKGELTKDLYKTIFKNGISYGISKELYSEKLAGFDLDLLANSIEPSRDNLLEYLGIKTLADRYLMKYDEVRFELPQTLWMRVAMGLAINEDNKNERAIEFYNTLSNFYYMTSTPTIYNAGTRRPQLSSCYLTTTADDLKDIFNSYGNNAQLSKYAGGLGNDWTNVRARNAYIKGTNGKSQGVIPFLRIVNDIAIAVNQGGKRKGAVCAYLESWHLDVEDFIDLKKNTGDERRLCHDLNTAHWIPDLLVKRTLIKNEDGKFVGEWTLFSPDEVGDLHDLYGKAFEQRYEYYEQQAKQGKIKNFKVINAQKFWQKMIASIYQTSHPWMTFKDSINIRSPQKHCGVVHSSNLCTEITLNTSADEIAVCNLGSVNLPKHLIDGKIDKELLHKTIKTAIRMLDNVIDINFYPVKQAENSNLRHRPIGLGVMGFQNILYQMRLPYDSKEAVEVADSTMELISYYAIESSALLAKERGKYSSYEGSLWSQNIFPIDSLKLLENERGKEFCSFDYASQLDWQPIRKLVAENGMRNSNVMAIAPTATICNITGVTQSIEPMYEHIFVKDSQSGSFNWLNYALVDDLKKLDLWDPVIKQEIMDNGGSIASIERIPDAIKAIYKTAFELDSHWLIEAGARRQKWLDQAQSLNLYAKDPNGRLLSSFYVTGWSRGLKTTYYFRSKGATSMQENDQLIVN